MQFQDCIEFNLNNDVGFQGYSPWLELWATACYYFWYWRNIQQHDDSFVYTCKPWEEICHHLEEIKICPLSI